MMFKPQPPPSLVKLTFHPTQLEYTIRSRSGMSETLAQKRKTKRRRKGRGGRNAEVTCDDQQNKPPKVL